MNSDEFENAVKEARDLCGDTMVANYGSYSYTDGVLLILGYKSSNAVRNAEPYDLYRGLVKWADTISILMEDKDPSRFNDIVSAIQVDYPNAGPSSGYTLNIPLGAEL